MKYLVGAEIARNKIMGEGNLKVLTPTDGLGVVGGADQYVSPTGLQGQVAIPSSIQPSQILNLFIDTTGNDSTASVSLFDAKDIHANSRSCTDCAPQAGAAEGTVYLTKENCNLYDSFKSMLCSKKYVVTAMRMIVTPTTDNANNPGVVSFPDIVIKSMNIAGDSRSTTIYPSFHQSLNQQVANIVDIPLTGAASLLDEFTEWKLQVPKGLKIQLLLTVSLTSK